MTDMANREPVTKKLKHSIFSEHFTDIKFQEIFRKHWCSSIPLKTENIEIIIEPFKICRISNFFYSEEFMDDIKNELVDVKTRRNSIDLYQFEQTTDLVNVDTKNIKSLYEIFLTHLTDWMKANTNIKLDRKISMSSSCYSDTDFLLCHDDNMSDRRIAYVLYLSKNWTEEDGGALDLFNTDENGLPKTVVKSLFPEYNSLIFFEVTENSFHQVAEVISPEKSRWSINGWFHGPILTSTKVSRPELQLALIEPENTNVDLNLWISNCYLFPTIIKEVQEDVEQDSFAYLSNFLRADVYEKLSEAVSSDDIRWNRIGPADFRNYEVADENSLPKILREFYGIFKSIVVCDLLKNYTELDLVPENDLNPKMTIELQRWSKGCYMLIADRQGYREYVPKKSTEPLLVESKDYESFRYHEDTDDQIHTVDPCCHTPPSSKEDDDIEEQEILEEFVEKTSPRLRKNFHAQHGDKILQDQDEIEAMSPKRKKTRTQAGSSKDDLLRRNGDDSDTQYSSDVSDIGDYLSDPRDCSFDCSEPEDQGQDEPIVGGALDVIMQFHTSKISEEETIDYIDPMEEDGALIHVPYKDNHMCLVYKTNETCRVHKYVNHYCKGYFYNLICTYYE